MLVQVEARTKSVQGTYDVDWITALSPNRAVTIGTSKRALRTVELNDLMFQLSVGLGDSSSPRGFEWDQKCRGLQGESAGDE